MIDTRGWKPLGSGSKHTVLSHDGYDRVLKLTHDQVLDVNGFTFQQDSSDENVNKTLLTSSKFVFQYLMITNICGGRKMICWSDQSQEVKEFIEQIASELARRPGSHILAHDIMFNMKNEGETGVDGLFESHLLPQLALVIIDPRKLSDDVKKVSLKKLLGIENDNSSPEFEVRISQEFEANKSNSKPKSVHQIIGLLESNAMMASGHIIERPLTSLDPVCITIEFKLKSPLPACIGRTKLLRKISHGSDTEYNRQLLHLIHHNLEWPPDLTRRCAYYKYGIKDTYQTWSSDLAQELLNVVREEDHLIPLEIINNIYKNEDGLSKIFVNRKNIGRGIFSGLISTEFKNNIFKIMNKERAALGRVVLFTAFSECQHILASAIIDAINEALTGTQTHQNEYIDEKLRSYKFNQNALAAFNWKEYKNCEDLTIDHALKGIKVLDKLKKTDENLNNSSKEMIEALEWLSRYRHGRVFSDCSIILTGEPEDITNNTVATKLNIVDLDFKEISRNHKIIKDMSHILDCYRFDINSN